MWSGCIGLICFQKIPARVSNKTWVCQWYTFNLQKILLFFETVPPPLSQKKILEILWILIGPRSHELISIYWKWQICSISPILHGEWDIFAHQSVSISWLCDETDLVTTSNMLVCKHMNSKIFRQHFFCDFFFLQFIFVAERLRFIQKHSLCNRICHVVTICEVVA